MKVDVVAFLHLVLGGFGLASVALMALGIFIAPDPLAIGFLAVAGGFAAGWGGVETIAGWGLLLRRRWSRLLALVLGAFQLLNFPFGPLVGIPTIAILLKDDALSEPSVFRRSGERLGYAAGGLLAGALLFPAAWAVLIAVMIGAVVLFMPHDALTPDQTAAMCRITDVPGAPAPTHEATDRTGPMLHYDAEAGDMAMVVRAVIKKQTHREQDLRGMREHFDPREHYFALRHRLRFEDRTDLPFDAMSGHWAMSASPPGTTLQVVDDYVNLTVSLAGITPSDAQEAERWFGRCWAALHALPPAKD